MQPGSPLPRTIVPHARPTMFESPESLGASAAAFASGDLPARIPLEARRAAKRFALEMTGSAHRSAGSQKTCAIDAETRLLQLNADGAVGSALTIFRGVVMHSCGPTDFDGEAPMAPALFCRRPRALPKRGARRGRRRARSPKAPTWSCRSVHFSFSCEAKGRTAGISALLEPGRLDNLAQLSGSPSGPSPLEFARVAIPQRRQYRPAGPVVRERRRAIAALYFRRRSAAR